MAQMNPNFEIDFSDINSYEQIQLINDTQLAKENLLMHRAYKEPSDDEIIRNHFSSFTFIDFCPKLFTAKTSGIRQQFINKDSSSVEHKQTLRHYELETFSDLFERINAWLKLNRNWRVVSMETLVYDCTSQFNHLKSSIHSNYLPQNTRGLRLFLSPSKSRFSGPQRIGCINVVPRKVSGSHTKPDEPVVYETLDEILQRLNELLLTRPIEGRILSVETITLPMVNGYVNTESNYFMDSRLNLLNQHTYNLNYVAPTMTSGTTNTTSALDPDLIATDSSQQQQGLQDSTTLRAHNLMDILRVYYEFGPMVCGLVNLIDFVPRFYSPTCLISPSDAAARSPGDFEPTSSNAATSGDPANTGQVPLAGQKIPSTESLTRLIRRSLAWFESERKLVLEGSAHESKQRRSEASVNLKACNLQVHHKTLLKSQLVQINQGNALTELSTRRMAHQSVAFLKPLTCSQCSKSTASNSAQEWCSHILDLSQVYQVKFVRLAYVVPVYNRYARPVNSLRSLRISYNNRGRSASGSQPSLSSSTRHPNSGNLPGQDKEGNGNDDEEGDDDDDDDEDDDDDDSSVTSSSTSSSDSSSSSRNPPPNSVPPHLLINQLDSPPAELQQAADSDAHVAQADLEKLTDKDEEEYTKQAALEIVSGTNLRHRVDEEANQVGQSDNKLNDSHIGQLTYRLFAPCQLVNSSSCFSINPVNSSSPLARRGSVDLNGGGSSRISSDNAHPSTSLLGSAATSSLAPTSSSNQYSEAQQVVTSFGAFFPALSFDIVGGSSSENPNSKAQAGAGSKFTTNEFEPVEAIRRRMEVYVTTNSMKVIAGETLIVNLSDILSCLSTAIEQTVVKCSFSAQAKPTTWVNVYVLYAAVEEPQLPGQLLAQQKLRELALIEENAEEEAAGQSSGSNRKQQETIFDDFFAGTRDDKSAAAAAAAAATTTAASEAATAISSSTDQQVPSTSGIRIEQNPLDSSLTLYNSAYDRTVALPTQPENHLDNLDPIDFLGSDTDCLWMNEADFLEAQLKQFQHIDGRRARKKLKAARRAAGKGRHEDSQCSIM